MMMMMMVVNKRVYHHHHHHQRLIILSRLIYDRLLIWGSVIIICFLLFHQDSNTKNYCCYSLSIHSQTNTNIIYNGFGRSSGSGSSSSSHGSSCSSSSSNSKIPLPSCINKKSLSWSGSSSLTLLHAKIDDDDSATEVNDGNFIWLQQQFNLTKAWAEKEISGYQRINNMNRTTMIERLDWLEQRLKLTKKEQATIVRRFPYFLKARPDTKIEPNLLFYEKRLNLTDPSLSRLIQKSPILLLCGVNEGQSIQRNLDWLEKRLRVTETKQLSKLVLACCPLLTCSVENNLDPTFTALQEKLNLNEAEMARICVKAPSILPCSYNDNIEPKLNWLQNRLDLDQKQLGKIIQRHPSLICHNVETTLEPNLKWLQERLGLNSEALRKIVIRQPNILTSSTSMKLEPILEWFEEQYPTMELSKLARIMTNSPSLFMTSIKNNLDPTLQFYKQCVGDEAALHFVLADPRRLGASLGNRLKPRLKEAQEYGLEIDTGILRRMVYYKKENWKMSLLYQQSKLERSKLAEGSVNE